MSLKVSVLKLNESTGTRGHPFTFKRCKVTVLTDLYAYFLVNRVINN